MKTVLAATLILFSVSTSALAFDIPNIDGLEGVQQMMQGKGKGGKRAQAQQHDEEGAGQQQQQSGRGGLKGQMQGLMNGDMSGLQDMMGQFGR